MERSNEELGDLIREKGVREPEIDWEKVKKGQEIIIQRIVEMDLHPTEYQRMLERLKQIFEKVQKYENKQC